MEFAQMAGHRIAAKSVCVDVKRRRFVVFRNDPERVAPKLLETELYIPILSPSFRNAA